METTAPDKIRNLISEDRLIEAIEYTLSLLDRNEAGLLDNAVILKQQFTDWKNKYNRGLNPPKEDKYRISESLLNLARDIESGAKINEFRSQLSQSRIGLKTLQYISFGALLLGGIAIGVLYNRVFKYIERRGKTIVEERLIELDINKNADEIEQTKIKADSLLRDLHNGQSYRLPVGTIIPYAGDYEANRDSLLKKNWLLCDGTELHQDEFRELYQVIGIAWGDGDRRTTFNIPDLRGQFIRGVSGSSDNDPEKNDRIGLTSKERVAKLVRGERIELGGEILNGGNKRNKVGSFQSHAFKRHNHDILKDLMTLEVYHTDHWNKEGVQVPAPGNQRHLFSEGFSKYKIDFKGKSTETRPQNVYVNFLIKVK